MSPQRKAPAVYTLIFSNQRHGSLDPVMTNSDLTDDEILTGVPPHRRCTFLTIRDLRADYLVGWLTGVQQEFLKWDNVAAGGPPEVEHSL